MRRLPILLPVAVTLLAVVGLKAADEVQAPSDPDLVYVYITATDRDGRFITMLPKQSFKLSEDRVPQEIVYFSEEPVPVRAAVLRSTNKATDGKFRKIKVTAEFVGRDKKVAKIDTRTRDGYYAPTPKNVTPPKN